MKKMVFSLLFVLYTCSLQAQTKVFREVSEDISTQFKPITQDNTLVGYLAFTRLEKADAVNSKKIMRTIPHKDGNIKINVYPGKEGHIIVSEYNRKEKYTRYPIEAP